MKCIICHNSNLTADFYRPNLYNGKEFHYNICRSCKTVSVTPIPSKNDFDSMYGEADHDYLAKLNPSDKFVHDFKWKKYHHQKYQVDEFICAMSFAKGTKMLDFACGNGFYLAYAELNNIQSVGVEYNQHFAESMSKKTGLSIISIDQLEKEYLGKKFDIIHFGHVLEHLANPYEMIESMRKYAHDDTIIIADGPLENNACLSQKFIRFGTRLVRKKFNLHAPQHLTFTTSYSQQLFFKNAGLKQLKFKVMEQDFPFRIEKPKSLLHGVKVCVSYVSIQISKLFPNMGNVFHYIGTFEKDESIK